MLPVDNKYTGTQDQCASKGTLPLAKYDRLAIVNKYREGMVKESVDDK